MIEPIHPAFILIIGVLLLPLFKIDRLKQIYLLLLPLLAFADLSIMPHGTYWTYNLMDYTITLGRVDSQSMVFAYIFVIFAFCAMLYALHLKEDGQHIAAYMYVGSALGVVFAGDLISLYVFWEIMAVVSTVLIFHQRTENAISAGMRYILVHATGGILLLGGIIMYLNATGSYAFEHFDYGTPGTLLILLGFIINAAVPPFHAWLSDAYPEATITGAVFLTAFTTKSAVYVLIRGFSGLEILMWLGAIMTIYGIIFAILENDMRRILAYSIINQVGFMVAGIGIGVPLALNGTSAHAFCHILYKGLLWMSAGAVLFMTGKRKCTELGGLYKTMPLTLIFCLVGAASISAFPLFNGFTSKPMIIEASAEENLSVIWLILQLASAGVFLHAGIKFPYFVFFAKDSGIRTREPPLNMLLGMGIVAFLCIFLGVYPEPLYRILPYSVHFVPYTASSVVGEMQLLLFSALAFFMFLKYLKRTETITLDTDWIYRKGGRAFMWFISDPLARGSERVLAPFLWIKDFLVWFSRNPKRAFFLEIDLLEYKLLGRIHGLTPEESIELISSEKSTYPGKPIHRDPVGDAVIVTLIFLFIYVVYYLL